MPAIISPMIAGWPTLRIAIEQTRHASRITPSWRKKWPSGKPWTMDMAAHDAQRQLSWQHCGPEKKQKIVIASKIAPANFFPLFQCQKQ